ncbi:hypothetical protein [Eubacterium ramulus]|uniref:hypothetical protein n=1 Tax=Eubacterium ramulus TaxID=39490 RepID=UPI00399AB852
MITREQLERIANNCGVKVSYSKPGDGGFIIESSGIKYKSMTDEFMKGVQIKWKKKILKTIA